LFYELIRPYERRVFVIVFSILRNEQDAEDAAQDAFLKAFKYLAQFRSESRFSTWLIQVAINEARLRQRKSHLEIMRPTVDQENEDGTYTPRDFTDWREISVGSAGAEGNPRETSRGARLACTEISGGVRPAGRGTHEY